MWTHHRRTRCSSLVASFWRTWATVTFTFCARHDWSAWSRVWLIWLLWLCELDSGGARANSVAFGETNLIDDRSILNDWLLNVNDWLLLAELSCNWMTNLQWVRARGRILADRSIAAMTALGVSSCWSPTKWVICSVQCTNHLRNESLVDCRWLIAMNRSK